MSAGVVEFTIPGTPVPFARTGTRGGQRFTPPKQRSAMGVIKHFAQLAMAGRAPMEGPIELTLSATYLKPASWSKKRIAETVWKTSKPDGDNLQKLIKDACNKVVWVDDAQVVRWVGEKRYGDCEQMRVTVRVLP
jgi:Holliday junction resolvase RusA-like endonuclease